MHTSAGAQDIAIREHDLEADDVMTRHAVLETARAAGIGRNVSADGAIIQTRWVGRIKQPLRADRRLQLAGDHTRLDDRHGVLETDFLDAVHPRERERDSPSHRHATAHVTKAGAARGHGNLVFGSKTQQAADLLGGL